MAGLKFLYNLILKDTVKGSGQASGILSIGKDIRKLADKKLQRYITAAKKQNVNLDKLGEQEIKYMMELNKPKEPRVFSNEEAYKFLNQFLKQGKGKKGEVIKFPKDKIKDIDKAKSRPPETEIIEGIETTKGFGDLFGRQLEKTVTVRTVIEDIKKLEPMDSMKETNRVLRGEGKYKNLSKADREKIASDESVTDHIFERNIIDETEDFAYGGVAGMLGERTGYNEGKKVGRPKGQVWTTGKGGGEDVVDPGFDELDSETWLKIIKAAMAGDYGPIEYADGGVARQNFAMGRRAFMKLLGGAAAGIGALKTGAFSMFGKKAAPVATEVVKSAGSGTTPPPYFFKLVEKIKILGDDVTPKYAVQERQRVTKYKDFELTEDIATGEKTIKRNISADPDVDGPSNMTEETYMNYRPGKSKMDETTKGKTPPDEYTEDTTFIRNDRENAGEIYNSVDGVGDDIIMEVEAGSGSVPESFYTGPNPIKKIKKASGGRVPLGTGKLVKGLGELAKKLAKEKARTQRISGNLRLENMQRTKIGKPKLSEDEYDYYRELLDDEENYFVMGDETKEMLEAMVKEADAEMNYMYRLYKKGALDPTPGEQTRGRLKMLENKAQSGVDMTTEEIKELKILSDMRDRLASGGIARMLGE